RYAQKTGRPLPALPILLEIYFPPAVRSSAEIPYRTSSFGLAASGHNNCCNAREWYCPFFRRTHVTAFLLHSPRTSTRFPVASAADHVEWVRPNFRATHSLCVHKQSSYHNSSPFSTDYRPAPSHPANSLSAARRPYLIDSTSAV